jgi:hypothetical protein
MLLISGYYFSRPFLSYFLSSFLPPSPAFTSTEALLGAMLVYLRVLSVFVQHRTAHLLLSNWTRLGRMRSRDGFCSTMPRQNLKDYEKPQTSVGLVCVRQNSRSS